MNQGELFAGKYRIERLLGSGGHAEVYLAQHVQLGRRVAIKVLSSSRLTERFTREGQILARLKSPHTVRIIDFGETSDGRWYLISEYVEGETLEQSRLRGPLTPDAVLDILKQILASLAEAHELGIVHRDIKPDNVMRLPDGEIKVLDFGIAVVPTEDDRERITASGVLLGTPRYMAPECLLGAAYGVPASDVYSTALLAYTLLVGRPAIEETAFDQILARHLRAEHSLPDDPAIPITLRRWFDIATQPLADERFADGGAALAFLDSVVAEPTAPVRAPAQPTSTPKPEVSDDLVLELDDPRPPPRSATQLLAPPPRPSRKSGNSKLLLFAGVLLAAGAGVVALAYDSPAPPVQARPDDPPEIRAAYDAGIAAFEEQDWITAIERFDIVRGRPSTNSARAMKHQDYWERTISGLLQEAVDLREGARSAKEFEAAALGPARVLELEPEHAAAQAVLLSITQEPKERRKKRRPRKIEITGVQ